MRTTVQTLVTKIKRRIDYAITDTDLDNLLVDCLNDSLKILRQKLNDRGIYYENTFSSILYTTASQAWIDLSLTPLTAPTVALISPAAAGNVNDGVHSYKVTFVTADGESLPSDAASVTVADKSTNGKVSLSAIPVAKINDVTSRKIYRTAAGGTTYYLLATIADNTTLVYTDNIADATLISGVAIPTISTIPSYSDITRVSERVNYKIVDVIPYRDFIRMYPDPAAFQSSVPDRCAIWNNRIYFGPTPTADNTAIYVDGVKHLADVVLTSNLPYETDYDPVLLALTRLEYMRFFDPKDRAAIKTAEESVDRMIDDLIYSSKNIGESKQVTSRREEMIFGPRIPASVTTIGP